MKQIDSKARARVTDYTASLFVFLASFLFFTFVPFIPDPPIIPFFVALALGAVSLRNRGASVTILYIMVFFAVLWQMIGFGFFQLLAAGVGVAVLVALVIPLLIFANTKVEVTSMTLAILCVSLMFTPAYFVSIPVIAAAAAVTGFASLEAISSSFILLLAPLLLLDNALFFANLPLGSAHAPPIIFGQLTYLSSDFRPSLPGLNVFLTALPANYMSPQAQFVSTFLINNWQLLVIPLALLGLIIFVSSFFGRLARSLLKKVARFRESSLVMGVVTPLAVSLVVPAAFLALLLPFSLPGAGGFQTSLSEASHLQIVLMLVSSGLLGTAFAGRESLVQRMESGEVARAKVEGLAVESRAAIDRARAELKEVSQNVPSLNVSGEERSLSEYSSYLDDVQRRLQEAGGESLIQWAERMGTVVLPSLGKSRERLTAGVLNELRTLEAVTETVNANLEKASVRLRFTQVPEAPADASLDVAVDLYGTVVSKIDEETRSLFRAYRDAFESFNRLMDLRGMGIPVSPDTLLASHEYVTAMRLVAEEYWLNFHLRYSEELESKKNSLLEQLRRLSFVLTGQQAAQLAGLMDSIKGAAPADSEALLRHVKDVRALLASQIKVFEDSPRVIKRAVESIDPKATRVIAFQTPRKMNEAASLRKDLDSSQDGFDSLTRFLAGAGPSLQSLVTSWGADREGLQLLAHYPTARGVIERMLSELGKVKVKNLPYGKTAAAIYVQLYAAENPKSSFDQKEGVLTSVA
jgi:hypothetical protein